MNAVTQIDIRGIYGWGSLKRMITPAEEKKEGREAFLSYKG
jgi:hypothetical protein